jgi:hypothetical protein
MRVGVPDRGWAWVVMLGSFGACVINGAISYGVGIVHIALLERFQDHVGKTAWAGGLFASMQSLAGNPSISTISHCRKPTFTM